MSQNVCERAGSAGAATGDVIRIRNIMRLFAIFGRAIGSTNGQMAKDFLMLQRSMTKFRLFACTKSGKLPMRQANNARRFFGDIKYQNTI